MRLFKKSFILSITILAPLCSPAFSAPAQKPNILLIYTDDLGYGDLSCYGATAIHTPHVDSIAKAGLRFTDAYAAAPTCTPSRYTLLTGHLAFRQKGTGILPGDAHLIIDTSQQTLPSMLKKAGYATACIGKWHLGLGSANQGSINWNSRIAPGPPEVGFDYSFILPATNDRVPCVYLENGKVANLDPSDPLQVDYHKKIGTDPTVKEFPNRVKVKCRPGDHHSGTIHGGVGRIGYMSGGKSARWNDETMADTLVSKASAFIRKTTAAQQPFFLYLALVDVHAPRLFHPRFAGKSELGPRGDMTLQLDDSVGQILKTLREEKLMENTLIIFSSDNGPKIEDAYLDGSLAAAKKKNFNPAGPLRGTKYTLFEGGTRVPFIVSWKGHIKPGVSQAIFGQVDLMASLAALTGQTIESPQQSDSQNHLPALLGQSATARNTIICGSRPNALSIRQNNWKLINTKRPQLFNLSEDLGERHNLAKSRPEKVKTLRAILKAEAKRYTIQFPSSKK